MPGAVRVVLWGRGRWDSPDHVAFWTLPVELGRRAARAAFLFFRDGCELQSEGTRGPVVLQVRPGDRSRSE